MNLPVRGPDDKQEGTRAMRTWIVGLLLWLPSEAAIAAQWRPIVGQDGQLFPALILATAGMAEPRPDSGRLIGDPNGLVGASVVAGRDAEPVRLLLRIPGLARDSILDATLPRAGTRYELYPTVAWDFAALRAMRQPVPATVQFELSVDAAPATQESRRVQVRAVNDAPYFAATNGGDADLSWIFAAYVNEDHPLVDRILAEALSSGIVERFDGYQSGSAEQVYRQVFAIWHVLRQRGIRYSSITRTSSPQARVLSQHVRFLDESWRNTQANCVDGSVLIASVLRRIEIEPTLVLLPGHMLLGFDLAPGGASRAYLETTMLGERARKVRAEPEASAEEIEEASFANFEAAVERGFAQYRRAQARLADPREPEYVLVPIAEARRLGVAPIASE